MELGRRFDVGGVRCVVHSVFSHDDGVHVVILESSFTVFYAVSSVPVRVAIRDGELVHICIVDVRDDLIRGIFQPHSLRTVVRCCHCG